MFETGLILPGTAGWSVPYLFNGAFYYVFRKALWSGVWSGDSIFRGMEKPVSYMASCLQNIIRLLKLISVRGPESMGLSQILSKRQQVVDFLCEKLTRY